MDIQKLLSCSEVLSEMHKNFVAMPEEVNEAVAAGLVCALAASYVSEFALHLSKGADSYDALLATAKGETKLTESQAQVYSLLLAKPKS